MMTSNARRFGLDVLVRMPEQGLPLDDFVITALDAKKRRGCACTPISERRQGTILCLRHDTGTDEDCCVDGVVTFPYVSGVTPSSLWFSGEEEFAPPKFEPVRGREMRTRNDDHADRTWKRHRRTCHRGHNHADKSDRFLA